ncbi:MAG: type II toxin-antitoxin system VapC family toxin [Anaerolineae bacterium]
MDTTTISITEAKRRWGEIVNRELIKPQEGDAVLREALETDVKLIYPDGLHRQAWEPATRFNCPTAYDAHYLALAEMFDCEFWTADRRLYNAVKEELHWVKYLGDFQPSDAPSINDTMHS